MKTEELVYTLLDKIDPAKDEIPSVRAIREALGKGSYGTIAAALRNWKKSHGLAEAIRFDSTLELDEESLREFAQALSRVFGPIVRARVAQARAECEENIAELTESLTRAQQALQDEIAKREAIESELANLRSDLEKERLAKARAEGVIEAMARNSQQTSEKDPK